MTKIQGVEALNLGSLNFVRTINEKDRLLDGFNEVLEGEANLSFKNLLYTLGAVGFVLALYTPKIYITNQIYKKSISLQRLEKELEYLRVERKEILRKIEHKKYQVEVLNAIGE